MAEGDEKVLVTLVTLSSLYRCTVDTLGPVAIVFQKEFVAGSAAKPTGQLTMFFLDLSCPHIQQIEWYVLYNIYLS